MRSIVNGAVLSLVLWTIVAWFVVCVGTWLDHGWSSSSGFAMLASLACMICATIATVLWMLHNGDAEPEATAGFDPIAKTMDAAESADHPLTLTSTVP